MSVLTAPSTSGQLDPDDPLFEPYPPTHGQWAGPFLLGDVINDPAKNDGLPDVWGEIVHAAMLPPPNDGLVLFWCRRQICPQGPSAQFPVSRQLTWLWDERSPGTLIDIEVPGTAAGHAEIFCSAHTFKRNGDLVTFGGLNGVEWIKSEPNPLGFCVPLNGQVSGTARVFVFDNASATWQQAQMMNDYRFYPTVVRVDDEVIVGGGVHHTGDPEFTRDIGTPLGSSYSWTPEDQLNYLDDPLCNLGAPYSLEAYARWHLLRTGKVFRTADVHSYLSFDVCSAGANPGSDDRFIPQVSVDAPPSDIANSIHVLYPDGAPSGNGFHEVIYAIGGSDALDTACDASITSQVWRMANPDLTLGTEWETGGFDLNRSRQTQNTVVALDGSLVSVGGFGWDSAASKCKARRRTELLRTPEIFGVPDSWSLVAIQSDQRCYHSTAVLTPAGKVVSLGGTRLAANGLGLDTDPASSWQSIELYSPPYFFQQARRPVITSYPDPATTPIRYDFDGTVPITVTASMHDDGSGDVWVALVAPGTATHAFDFNQRYIKLRTTRQSATVLNFLAPPSGNVAPPGWYMLTVVNANRLPSVARWVIVGE